MHVNQPSAFAPQLHAELDIVLERDQCDGCHNQCDGYRSSSTHLIMSAPSMDREETELHVPSSETQMLMGTLALRMKSCIQAATKGDGVCLAGTHSMITSASRLAQQCSKLCPACRLQHRLCSESLSCAACIPHLRLLVTALPLSTPV